MLLTSKLCPPEHLSPELPRAELHQALHEALARPLVLLKAPDGYGKTRCLSTFAQQHPDTVRWYGLDERDNTPVIFWSYLATSLQMFNEKLGKRSRQLLEAEAQRETLVAGSRCEDAIHCLLEDLHRLQRSWHCPSQLILIWDAFQHLKDPELISQINGFLDRLPGFIRVVISCPHVPPLEISQRLARDQVSMIGVEQLRLRGAESVDLLQAGTTLTQSQCLQLHQKAEGWLGALLLLKNLINQRQSSVEDILNTPGAQQLMADFLFGASAPTTDPAFMNHLQIVASLPRFQAPVLANLLGEQEGAELLTRLQEQSLIREIGGSGQHWYRLNNLVQDWIHASLPLTVELYPSLRPAMNWYAEQGLYPEALDLATQIEDWPTASTMTAEALPELIRRGHYHQAEQLLRRFPNDLIAQTPSLMLLRSFIDARRVGFASNTSANHRPDDNTEASQETQALACLLRADLLRNTDNLEAAHKMTLAAAELLEGHTQAFDGWVLLGLGTDDMLAGQLDSAYSRLMQATQVSQDNLDGPCLLTALCWLGPLFIQKGMLESGLDALSQWQAWLKDQGFDALPMSSVVDRARLLILVELDRLAEAADAAERLGRFRDQLDPLNQFYSRWAEFRLAQTNEPPQALHARLDQIQHFVARHFNHWCFAVPDLTVSRALLNLRGGNPDAIVRWSSEFASRPPVANQQRHLTEETIYLRVCIGAGQDKEREVQHMRQQAQESGWVHREIYSVILLAFNARQRGRSASAQKYIEKALQLAAFTGYVRLFLDEGAEILPLLKQASPDASYNELLRYLITRLAPDQACVSAKPTQVDREISPLSERETEVLKLVAAGQTNQQMADQLNITASTIKRHLHNIYAKLEVKRRTQALAFARSRGWID